jgi:periplasmic protein TonB
MPRFEFKLMPFLAVSFIVHLGLILSTGWIKSKPSKTITVEISYGTGNSRGGSAPLKVKPKPAIMTKSKQNPVAKADQVTTSEAAVQKSAGTGTGEGSGSGSTSGAGEGFNDPLVKYRGMIYQLLNSKKQYPRKARALQQTGRVVIKIKLSREGKLLAADIVESCPYQVLTKASLEAVKSVEKFPSIPSELAMSEYTIDVPFDYNVMSGDVI